jgi:DNA-binding NtrC family response regulator
VVSASNKDLKKMVAAGEFREDLYYRVNAITIRLPSLRERREDIPLLVQHFLRSFQPENTPTIADSFLAAVLNYDWPGNIRELRNAVERALLLCDDAELGARHLPEEIRARAEGRTTDVHALLDRLDAGSSLKTMVHGYEKKLILAALEKFEYNQLDTANFLGIPRRTLNNKIHVYGIETPKE